MVPVDIKSTGLHSGWGGVGVFCLYRKPPLLFLGPEVFP